MSELEKGAGEEKRIRVRYPFPNLFAHPVTTKLFEITMLLSGTWWKEYRENRMQSFINPPPEGFAVRADDGVALAMILAAVSDALSGMSSYLPVRRMAAALRSGQGMQERQIKAVDACKWARRQWQRIDRRRKARESKEEQRARLREPEERVAHMLIQELGTCSPEFLSLRPSDVRQVLERQRANKSPIALMLEIAVLAEVWSSASFASVTQAIKRAKKRKSGT